jgi:hypothetical protein
VESKTEIIFSWGVWELGRLGENWGVGEDWGSNLKRPKPAPHKGYIKIISKIEKLKTTKSHRSIYR